MPSLLSGVFKCGYALFVHFCFFTHTSYLILYPIYFLSRVKVATAERGGVGAQSKASVSWLSASLHR